MISTDERFSFEEALKDVKSFLTELISPTSQEELFLSHFADGKYRPELLFEDSEIVERIKNHPMAVWKTQNTISHKKNRLQMTVTDK